MKLEIEKKACIACGNCNELESTIFMKDAKGKATVPSQNLEDVSTSFSTKLVRKAVNQCPMSALTLTE